MLLNSVIIILREVLEAALLLSILMAMTRFLQLRFRWLFFALMVGFSGAIFYGTQLAAISSAYEGVGQELLNAVLQTLAYGLLIIITVLMIVNHYKVGISESLLQVAMATAVAATVTHEGSEIFIYLSALRYQPEAFSSVLCGALLGVGIGFSIGALLYYLLLSFPRRHALLVTCVLLTLVGGAMYLQVARELIQADWLPAEAPLWDTSWLLPEDSITGQLLYALIGYEATPSPLEVFIYLVSMLLMAVLLLITWFVHRKNKVPHVVQLAG
ncbi:FTR1 family protein [Microbulbifer variabilis]|uniref:FTR1 family protein n=1 Tax=Microbulbifer variabilis TaxID=266805 RepID=UPI001CFEF76E|nr:FTR1 family protein [Microbulbifer variabilis]